MSVCVLLCQSVRKTHTHTQLLRADFRSSEPSILWLRALVFICSLQLSLPYTHARTHTQQAFATCIGLCVALSFLGLVCLYVCRSVHVCVSVCLCVSMIEYVYADSDGLMCTHTHTHARTHLQCVIINLQSVQAGGRRGGPRGHAHLKGKLSVKRACLPGSVQCAGNLCALYD